MNARPPRLLRRLLGWIARPEDREAVLHDLDAEFETRLAEGERAGDARSWYRRQVATSLLPLLRSRMRRFALLPRSRISWIDVRLGVRMLGKYPGLTTAAVLSLAVGIPVGLAPWHAASVFEAELPVEEGERVRVLKLLDPSRNDWAASTVADWTAWRDLDAFAAVGAFRRASFNLATDDVRDPPVPGALMTASAFEALGVRPALGRVLLGSDEMPGSMDVVILGHELWSTRFARDPDVVGRTVQVGGRPHTVVGVMPEGFGFPYRDRLWTPLRSPEPRTDERRVVVFGRLADGVDAEAATAELQRLERSRADARPDGVESGPVELQAHVVPFTEGLFGLRPGGLRSELGFFIVQGLALMVLLVACVNISMLLLVRTTARARELSVRAALGAGRGRIVAQLFIEAFVLAAVAAAAGLVIGDWIAGRLTFISELLPYWTDLGVRWATALQALGLAALSAAVVGVLPALKVTGGSIQAALQRAGAGRTGVRFGGMASALIVLDVALAVVVTGVAFAFADGIMRAVPLDGGVVRGEEYLVAEIRAPSLMDGRAESSVGHVTVELIDRLRREPGVRAVAMAEAFPGMDRGRGRWEVEGRVPREANDAYPPSDVVHVVPGYFEALGQSPLAGRAFRPADAEDDAAVAIVDTEFVDRYMEGRSPVGARVRRLVASPDSVGPWIEVVGLVGGIGNSGTEVRPTPTVYLPARPSALRPAVLAVHAASDPGALAPSVRRLTAELDPTAVVDGVKLLPDARSFDVQVMGWLLVGVRLVMLVLVALAASGTYSLLSFAITERAHEISIRAAMGASAFAVVRTIGRRAATQLLGGAWLGVAALALVYTQFVSDGWTPPGSPVAMAVAIGVGVTAVIGVLAGVGPARRSVAIEPGRALRG